MPWRESVELASEAGYDAVDVDLVELELDGDAAPAKTLREADLLPGPAMLPVEFRRGQEEFERDLAALPARAALAASAGVRTLTRSLPASSATPATELMPVLVARLKACAQITAENGQQIAIEGISPLHLRSAHAYPFVWRLIDVLAVAEACGDDVGVVVDTWHCHHAGDTAFDVLKAGRRILAVHIADSSAAAPEDVRDMERLVPGEGVIDLAGWARALQAAGWRGVVTPEVFDDARARLDLPEQRARTMLAATRAVYGGDA